MKYEYFTDEGQIQNLVNKLEEKTQKDKMAKIAFCEIAKQHCAMETDENNKPTEAVEDMFDDPEMAMNAVENTDSPMENSMNSQEEDKDTVIEQFSNKVKYGNYLLRMDLVLRSVLYGCLFFVLAHSDTRNFLKKVVSKKMMLPYVTALVFMIAYYLINLYI